jgi:hypothetical protein
MIGCALSENRGKVSGVFQQIISIEMEEKNRRGHPITLRESRKG